MRPPLGLLAEQRLHGDGLNERFGLLSQPSILPLFPLSGSLLLPGGLLPLHVFEERYCNLVEDIIDGHGTLGMIQPKVPDVADNHGESMPSDDLPPLYGIGCAGFLDQVQRLPHGRFLVILKGLRRFRLKDELEVSRGYRQALVDYREFQIDVQDREAEVETERLLAALDSFGKSQGLTINLEKLGEISGLALLNGLAMNLPFAPVEKQALLEAPNAQDRYEMLLGLFDMGFIQESDLAH